MASRASRSPSCQRCSNRVTAIASSPIPFPRPIHHAIRNAAAIALVPQSQLVYSKLTSGPPRRLMRLILAFCALTAIAAAADEPLLLQKPTLSKTHIVFVYAGDL